MNRLDALQEAVRAWLLVKAEKAEVMKDYNERIKELQSTIEALSNRIEEDKHQLTLPLSVTPTMNIDLDEADA